MRPQNRGFPVRAKVILVKEKGIKQVYVRAIDSLNLQALNGTEGAGFIFWSPDSRSLAFCTDDRKLNAPGRFDVSRDNKHVVLMLMQQRQFPITLVTNWDAAIKK